MVVLRFAKDYRHGSDVPKHRHSTDQHLFASSGVMTLQTEQGDFVVPPNRAAWVPAGASHAVRMFADVSMRTLYFKPGLAGSLPKACFVTSVTPLLRELILFVVNAPSIRPKPSCYRRILQVIVDQLVEAQHIPLWLPIPADPRARTAADLIMSSPTAKHRLEELAKTVHVSKRTLERVFKTETGMSLREWYRQARVHRAMVLLAAGSSVTNVALDVGYSSTSAFVAAFRKVIGDSPAHYVSRRTE